MSLAEKYRPKKLVDICGQEYLVGQYGILTKMLDDNNLSSCIFYGPPGCGKTTTALIIAEQCGMNYVKLNATNAKLDDIRKAVPEDDSRVLVYLDEIQYFNKKQQQSLLPYIESGKMILIGATTENPYHSCYDALLSRCSIFEFKPIDANIIADYINDIANKENRVIHPDAQKTIANQCGGDVRRALNLLELIMNNTQGKATIENDDVKKILPQVNMASFDLNGDTHYGLISALQKSIRGSDPNAAVFYLARLLEGGDLLSPCRRLLVIASEDIGFGNPWAVPFVYACVESAKQLGLPEASIPLTNAVICLAISKKCSTSEFTYNPAAEDVKAGKGSQIPAYLHHACSTGYLYPHEYPYHWCPQQYLPNDLVGAKYYNPGDNEFEQEQALWWKFVREQYTKNNQK